MRLIVYRRRLLPVAGSKRWTVSRSAAPEIPVKNRARIRTLVKYGMSVSEVADLYRVPVERIERILRKGMGEASALRIGRSKRRVAHLQ